MTSVLFYGSLRPHGFNGGAADLCCRNYGCTLSEPFELEDVALRFTHLAYPYATLTPGGRTVVQELTMPADVVSELIAWFDDIESTPDHYFRHDLGGQRYIYIAAAWFATVDSDPVPGGDWIEFQHNLKEGDSDADMSMWELR